VRKLSVVLALAALVLLLAPQAAQASGWVTGSACVGSNCRNYKLWVPAEYNEKSPAPLVMMLHGCLLTPDSFAAITQMNALADKNKFLVVYPEQPATANPALCWNWFDPANQVRGSGEAAILASIVQQVESSYRVDQKRVYVAGISAGGAMTVIMGATYPDLFAAIAVHSGLEYKAGTDVWSGLAAMKYGGPDPDTQGTFAYAAMGDYAHRMPTIVFQGAADKTVAPSNADQVVEQWAETNDWIDDGKDNDSVSGVPVKSKTGTVPDGYAYTEYLYENAHQQLLMQKWIVAGMDHAWSGGAAGFKYSDPKGPDASLMIWRFFEEFHR
jgi:poly(hydroxyalkanoate) depolymerase family esterase